MPMFPTKEWYLAMIEWGNNQPDLAEAGKDWEGDVIQVVEAEPGKLEKDFCVYSKPHHGKVEVFEVIDDPDSREAEYVIRAPYSVWKAIIKREVDGMQMMMKGKIRIEGDMEKLLRYAKYQQLSNKVLSEVETTFIDEQGR